MTVDEQTKTCRWSAVSPHLHLILIHCVALGRLHETMGKSQMKSPKSVNTQSKNPSKSERRSPIPTLFAVLLAALFVLDLASHRLYKQALQRAREFNQ